MNRTEKGKNPYVDDPLRDHIDNSLEIIFSKYFSNSIETTVTLSKQTCLCSAQFSTHSDRSILPPSKAWSRQTNGAYHKVARFSVAQIRQRERRLGNHSRVDRQTQLIVRSVVPSMEHLWGSQHGLSTQ